MEKLEGGGGQIFFSSIDFTQGVYEKSEQGPISFFQFWIIFFEIWDPSKEKILE